MLLSNINIRRMRPRVLSKTQGFKPEPSASAHTVSVHSLYLYTVCDTTKTVNRFKLHTEQLRVLVPTLRTQTQRPSAGFFSPDLNIVLAKCLFFSLLYCFILNMLYNSPLCHVGSVVTAGFGHFFYVSSVAIKLKSKFCLKADLKQTHCSVKLILDGNMMLI